MLTTYRILLEMMTAAERKRFWILVAVTFALTVLEVGSVVSILPFLRLLAEPGLIETTPILARLYALGGFESTQGFLIMVGIVVFVITILGLVTKMVTIWATTRFALMRSYSLSARLLANYLHQPYEWFLSRHSSDLGNAILSEVDQVVSGALLPAVRIIPELFAVALLVGALCLIEPEIAIGGLVLLGGVYGAIFLFARQILSRIGETRLAANQARFHVVQEATGGAKELKIMGLEAGFFDRFRTAAYRMARAQTKGQVISTLPRQAIEAVSFGGVIVIILVLLVRNDGNVANIVPTLGLIAAVGIRMIPALQQIYHRAASVRQTQATLTRIHADLTGLAPAPLKDRKRRNEMPAVPLRDQLELDRIRYAYPGTDRPTLDNLSLSIRANTTVGIVGGTGAGKTTLVDVMLGLLVPSDGQMRVDGIAVTEETCRAWQKTLGYVPQSIFLTDGTVAENIAFGLHRDTIDMAAVERAARSAALHEFVVSELPEGYDTHVGERGVRLSGGQRQRVGIARALYYDPAMLIFDEATSALDTLTEAAVMEAVGNLAGQKTVVMIAHRLTTIRNCDTIFLLRDGRVVAEGDFKTLVATQAEFLKMADGLAVPAP